MMNDSLSALVTIRRSLPLLLLVPIFFFLCLILFIFTGDIWGDEDDDDAHGDGDNPFSLRDK